MAKEIFMPKTGMDMTEGKLIKWFKNVGDTVTAGEDLFEIETDKITMQVEAPASGTLLCKLRNDRDVVPVVTVIGYIGKKGEKIPEKQTLLTINNTNTSEKNDLNFILKKSIPKKTPKSSYFMATPLAKKIMKEKEISPENIVPTGSYGEIKFSDVQKYIDLKNSCDISPLAKKIAEYNNIEITNIHGSGYKGKILKEDVLKEIENKTRRVKISGIRKVIFNKMSKSNSEIPPVTQSLSADVTELLEFRKELNKDISHKITINDFIVKAVAKALERCPFINIRLDGDYIIKNKEINLGIAVSLNEGIVVPVIKDANKLSLYDISLESKRVSESGRRDRFNAKDALVSSMTITNLGMFGIEDFTPIINYPEASILGVCTVKDELSLINNNVCVRKKIKLCYTYDHRIIDGVPAAKFLCEIKKELENPHNLLN